MSNYSLYHVVEKSLSDGVSDEFAIKKDFQANKLAGRLVSVTKKITADMIGANAGQTRNVAGPLIYRTNNHIDVVSCNIFRMTRTDAGSDKKVLFKPIVSTNFYYYLYVPADSTENHLHIVDTGTDGASGVVALKENDVVKFLVHVFPKYDYEKQYVGKWML